MVAAALIAERQCNTLILVHRRELLNQWVERLGSFLTIDPKQIGTLDAGKRKPTGIIDVALIQSLVRGGEVDNLRGVSIRLSPCPDIMAHKCRSDGRATSTVGFCSPRSVKQSSRGALPSIMAGQLLVVLRQ